jgi:integrase
MAAKKKTSWPYATGEKGRNRVRAFEDNKTGIILLEWWENELGSTAPRRQRYWTRHRDRDRAKREADELAARIGKKEPPPTQELTLRSLFDMYLREKTPQKGSSKRDHDARCAEMLLRFFGNGRKPSTLSRRDWDRFINDRRLGAIRTARVGKVRKVGSRAVAYDLKFLLSVLGWATTAADAQGRALLDRNPLKGLAVPNDGTPARPILSDEQYVSLQAVAGQVGARFELALALAHETGHRVSAIRLLRWSDIDLEKGRVRWRAENDKIGFEHTTALSEDALAVLSKERRAKPFIGDRWIFPLESDQTTPCGRYDFQNDFRRALKLAQLPTDQRLGWHSLRRKFATELKTLPLTDLSYLGGWKEPMTVVKCYQRPDEHTQRTALAARVRVAAG